MLLFQITSNNAFFPPPWSRRFYFTQVDNVLRYFQVSLIVKFVHVTKSWLMYCRNSSARLQKVSSKWTKLAVFLSPSSFLGCRLKGYTFSSHLNHEVTLHGEATWKETEFLRTSQRHHINPVLGSIVCH